MSQARILVVDDEPFNLDIVAEYLDEMDFDLVMVDSGEAAWETLVNPGPAFDLVLLDRMMPGLDGIEVCRQLRVFSDAYVVMLTARDTEIDTIVGLSVGADDYVTKPFSPREVVARIRAMLRRPRRAPESAPETGTPPRVFGDLHIDTDSRQTLLGGAPIMLTRTEFDVLAALSSRPRQVWTERTG